MTTNLAKFRIVSFKETNAMEDVTKGTLVPSRVLIELAIVGTELQLVCLHLTVTVLHTIHVVS